MPIHGLTDQSPAFREIGRIRKGGAKEENRIGAKIPELFRVTFRDDADAQLAEKNFLAAYDCQETRGGTLVKRINFFIAFPEIDRSWDAYWEVYSKGGLIGKADGLRWTFFRDNSTHKVVVRHGVVLEPDDKRVTTDETGELFFPFNATVPVYSYRSKKKQKDIPVFPRTYGRLRVIVPECQTIKHVTLVTNSIYDIAKISSQLNAISLIAQQSGRSIVGIPLVMTKNLEEISTPLPDGGRVKRPEWLVNIAIEDGYAEREMQYLVEVAYPDRQLPSGFEHIPDELYQEDEEGMGEEPEIGHQETETEVIDGEVTNGEEIEPAEIKPNDYWNLVYHTLGWSTEDGQNTLRDSGNDFAIAFAKAKKQVHPDQETKALPDGQMIMPGFEGLENTKIDDA